MFDSIVGMIEQSGYLGILFLMLLENIFPPIPSEVIMPLAAPAVFTTAILAFISAWNEFLIASQLSNSATQTVTVAIASFAGSQPQEEPYTAVMAAGTIVVVPLVILVLIFQRKIVAGLTAGAVK